MKLAISGKGGVGKTTFAALLAQTFADSGRQVFVVDADPSPCLAKALGFPKKITEQLKPISEMVDLIEERTGVKSSVPGSFFTFNPRVDDIPDRYSVVHNRIRLLEMGSVVIGGGGCTCAESAMLKTLLTHLLFRRDDVLILDMYAGVEHLGRATVDFVDGLFIVVEPSNRSMDSACQIKKMSEEIGIRNIWLVGNKIRNEEDKSFIFEHSPGLPVLGIIREDPSVLEADRCNEAVYAHTPHLQEAIKPIVNELFSLVGVGTD